MDFVCNGVLGKYVIKWTILSLTVVSTFCLHLVYAKDEANKEMLSATDTLPAVDCVIQPHKVIDLSSAVPGVIGILNVERSERVIKGQVVAELAAGVEKATVALAKLRASVQSEIKSGEISLDFDQRRKDRLHSLYQKKAVPFERLDEADREMNLSVWKLEQARELANIRNLELQRAEEQLKQKTILSPIDGFILETFKLPGEYVEDHPIVRIAKLNPLTVEAIVPMNYYGEINEGMSVDVYPEILNGKVFRGKVSRVDRMGDAASGTFGVRAVLPNQNNQLTAGQKCELKFSPDKANKEIAKN